MDRRRDLVVANAAALVLLAVVWLIGWREAALYGLGVLAFMDVISLVRTYLSGHNDDPEA